MPLRFAVGFTPVDYEPLRWYAYCSPAPFSRELAIAMRTAGMRGIDFGADNGNQQC